MVKAIREKQDLLYIIHLQHLMAPKYFLKNKMVQMEHGVGVKKKLILKKIELIGLKVKMGGLLIIGFMQIIEFHVRRKQFGLILT